MRRHHPPSPCVRGHSGGNYYGPNMSYPEPSPRTFGFIADNAAHDEGTFTFDFSADPAWPNFIWNGATHGYSWSPSCPSPGVRTPSPLGDLCCAPGGCIAQQGNVTAAREMTRKHVLGNVSPTLEGNW